MAHGGKSHHAISQDAEAACHSSRAAAGHGSKLLAVARGLEKIWAEDPKEFGAASAGPSEYIVYMYLYMHICFLFSIMYHACFYIYMQIFSICAFLIVYIYIDREITLVHIANIEYWI